MFALPVLSLFLCSAVGLYLHYEEVTSTHCKVPNFMPSISALIGTPPECYIWQVAIALFSSPRIFDALLYHNFFKHCATNNRKWFRWMNRALLVLHIWQYMSLLILTFTQSHTHDAQDKHSLRLRAFFVGLHFVSFFLSLYVYWRHNTYCEPYVYSIFGILEYLVILSNIAYHTVQVVDFRDDYYISIAHPSRLKHT